MARRLIHRSRVGRLTFEPCKTLAGERGLRDQSDRVVRLVGPGFVSAEKRIPGRSSMDPARSLPVRSWNIVTQPNGPSGFPYRRPVVFFVVAVDLVRQGSHGDEERVRGLGARPAARIERV